MPSPTPGEARTSGPSSVRLGDSTIIHEEGDGRRTRLEDDGNAMGGSVSTLAASPAGRAHASRASSARRRAETDDSQKAGRVWAREVSKMELGALFYDESKDVLMRFGFR